ncbi:MAG: spermidine synthase, partial [Chloroflexi bacterium]|nr:spermidine synthase [Chloroflexota bacterium]
MTLSANLDAYSQPRARLFLTSFAILFFELAAIRWIPAHVRFLSYFTNFVLLASFLGIGLGILASHLKRFWFPPFPLMLFVLCLMVALNRLEIRFPSTQVLYYGAGEGIANTEHYFVLPLVFVLVAL